MVGYGVWTGLWFCSDELVIMPKVVIYAAVCTPCTRPLVVGTCILLGTVSNNNSVRYYSLVGQGPQDFKS